MQNLTSSIAFPGPEQLCVCRAGDIVSHLRAGSVRQLSHIPFVSRPKSCDLSLCHSAGLPAVPLRVTTLLKGQLVWLNSSLHFATTYSCCWMRSAQWLLPFTFLQLKMMVEFGDDRDAWWQSCSVPGQFISCSYTVILVRPRHTHEMMQFALPIKNSIGGHSKANILFLTVSSI